MASLKRFHSTTPLAYSPLLSRAIRQFATINSVTNEQLFRELQLLEEREEAPSSPSEVMAKYNEENPKYLKLPEYLKYLEQLDGDFIGNFKIFNAMIENSLPLDEAANLVLLNTIPHLKSKELTVILCEHPEIGLGGSLSDKYSKVKGLYEFMKQKEIKIQSRVFEEAAKSLAFFANYGWIRNIIERMSALGIPESISVYNSLLYCYANHGLTENAYTIFTKADDLGIANERTNALLLLSLSKGNRKDLYGQFERFKQEGKVTTTCYNILIGSHLVKCEADEAISLFNEMKGNKNTRPNEVTLRVFMKYFFENNNFKEAASFVEQASNFDLQNLSKKFDALAIRIYSKFDPEKLQAYLKKAFPENEKEDQSYLAIYNAVLSVLNDYTALILAKEALREFFAKDASTLIENHPQFDDVSAILDPLSATILRRMHANKIDANNITFDTVIRKLCITSNFTAAKVVFERMREQKVVPTKSSFNSYLMALLKTGDSLGASELQKEMSIKKIAINKPNTEYLKRLSSHA